MRCLKTMFGVAAALCALGGAAASASASEFEASGASTHGVSVSKNEVFRVYPMVVTCARAETKGTTTPGRAETFTDEVKYSACTAFSGQLKVAVTPGHFEYNANGTVAILEPIKISPVVLACHYEIPAQASFTKEAVFFGDVTTFGNKKFPEGQMKLQVESTIEGMEYLAVGWPCTGPKTPPELKEGKEAEETGSEGKFNGKVEETVTNGNFTWLK